MKQKLVKLLKKNKKTLIIAFVGCLFVLSGYIIWDKYYAKLEMFKKEETKFLDAVKNYYSYRSQYLPKNGDTREITLEDLYLKDQIDTLYIPGTKKSCNPKSWVRVYNDNNEYKYTTYLECGKYKSKVDSKGPVITLNGDKTVYLSLNTKYEELGVKSVTDDKDGKMNVENVVIDSSKIDNSKIGEYKVTYTVSDSSLNTTVVTRKVIVSKGLTDTVKNATVSTEGYYRGISNNYVLFSGVLYRIIQVNSDGTIKMITDEAISSLRMDYDKYDGSNVDTWLNKEFYNSIHDADKYIVDAKYCVGKINSKDDYGSYCDQNVTRKVGMSDIVDYYKTLDNGVSSIYSKGYAISNKADDGYLGLNYEVEGFISFSTISILAPIRPVITLKNNLSISSGDGTKDNPYKLNDYDYANKSDILNTRIPGEYFEYSGIPFRIIKVDKDNNVLAIMANAWIIQPDDNYLKVSYTNLDKTKFSTTEDGNPGYLINNEYLDYMDTKNIVTTEYQIPLNVNGKKYSDYQTTKVKAKILLPKTFELFSSADMSSSMYPYIDESSSSKSLFAANATTSQAFELTQDAFQDYAIKAVITVKGDLRIESGKGTAEKPYKVK